MEVKFTYVALKYIMGFNKLWYEKEMSDQLQFIAAVMMPVKFSAVSSSE